VSNDQLRSWVYSLLTVVAVAAVAARICNAELVFEPSLHRNADEVSPPAPQRPWPARRPTPMPTFSSNDRSRWCTVRALVDDGTYAIGHRFPAPPVLATSTVGLMGPPSGAGPLLAASALTTGKTTGDYLDVGIV